MRTRRRMEKSRTLAACIPGVGSSALIYRRVRPLHIFPRMSLSADDIETSARLSRLPFTRDVSIKCITRRDERAANRISAINMPDSMHVESEDAADGNFCETLGQREATRMINRVFF